MTEIKIGQIWEDAETNRVEILDIAGSLITVECRKSANLFGVDKGSLVNNYRKVK